MSYGLTSAGFVQKPLTVIKEEIEADLRTAFGQTIDLSPQESLGQFVGIFSERISELWQLGEAIYNSDKPDAAAGTLLDMVVALTGTARKAPTNTLVTVTACGTVGTVLATGRVASIPVSGTRFQSLAGHTIAVVAAWASAHAYVVGDRVTTDTRVFECTRAGTSASTNAALVGAALGALVIDSGVTWRCIGTGGAGAVDVDMAAQTTGPLVANAGTVTTIETAVSGWSSVYNVADETTLGTDLESDASLRFRREQELGTQTGALEAILRAVAGVAGVTQATVFENDLDFTADGIPPHSIEVLADGGAEADIRAAIFATKDAGIGTSGTVTGTVTDSEGITHEIDFSRSTLVPIWADVDLITNAKFPLDGRTQVKDALAAYALATWKNGTPVEPGGLLAAAFAVTGVIGALRLPYVKISSGPTLSDPIAMTPRQRATLDTTHIQVNGS